MALARSNRYADCGHFFVRRRPKAEAMSRGRIDGENPKSRNPRRTEPESHREGGAFRDRRIETRRAARYAHTDRLQRARTVQYRQMRPREEALAGKPKMTIEKRNGMIFGPGFVEPSGVGYTLTEAKASVGAGWHRLLEAVWRRKDETSFGLKEKPNFIVVQVKEKFGGLRIYVDNRHDETIHGFLDGIEAASYTICEECGNSGFLRTDRHWIRTLCDAHAETVNNNGMELNA